MWAAGTPGEGMTSSGGALTCQERNRTTTGKRGRATPRDVRVARSYALLGQGTEATCNVLVSGKYVQALLDTEACISILRLKDFKALNQKNRLEAADMKIIQADR